MDQHSAKPNLQRPVLPVEFCNAFRRAGGKLQRESGVEESLIGACAVHTGIQFMLRQYGPEDVAAWLEREARELRDIVSSVPLADR